MRIELTIIFMLYCMVVNAQLFTDKELYRDVKTIKEKYYNGSGGGSYWSLKKINTQGQIEEESRYKKNKLLAKFKNVYNSHNDQIYRIQIFDINNTNRTDTLTYSYKYDGDRIIYQKSSKNPNDSVIIKLIENKADSVVTYQYKSYHFRKKTKKTDVYEKIYSLTYEKDLLVKKEIHNVDNDTKVIITYEYYPNQRLKRKVTEREPKSSEEIIYLGGPGSDDISYEYKIDKTGKIKKYYAVIKGKKYKIAAYRYNKE